MLPRILKRKTPGEDWRRNRHPQGPFTPVRLRIAPATPADDPREREIESLRLALSLIGLDPGKVVEALQAPHRPGGEMMEFAHLRHLLGSVAIDGVKIRENIGMRGNADAYFRMWETLKKAPIWERAEDAASGSAAGAR